MDEVQIHMPPDFLKGLNPWMLGVAAGVLQKYAEVCRGIVAGCPDADSIAQQGEAYAVTCHLLDRLQAELIAQGLQLAVDSPTA